MYVKLINLFSEHPMLQMFMTIVIMILIAIFMKDSSLVHNTEVASLQRELCQDEINANLSKRPACMEIVVEKRARLKALKGKE